ncbi:MAG: tRNA adenosine(34) deaminase TadA [Clostridia bacterium]|nr:tRNA adenosine(34) deaminase TadA [Clostridia bacterium]
MDVKNGLLTADTDWMRLALAEAQKAAQKGETPIGAVVVRGGAVVACAHNAREQTHDITAHAELMALRAAGEAIGDWRLGDCTLYVTLEPCPMCAGAILAARVGRVVYGAKDATAGAMGSVLNLPRYPLGARPAVTGGVLEEECRTILQTFFQKKRKEKQA